MSSPCAAVGDVIAWCLLTLVVAVAGSGSPLEALTTAGWVALLATGMVTVVRPLLARVLARREDSRGGLEQDGPVVVLVFSGMCLSAFATETIGVHALFGAFLFGLVMPRRSAVAERSSGYLRGVAVLILLPLFFVSTGLRTDFAALAADPEQWVWAAAVTAVALVGKWGGASAAARLCGRDWGEALSLGALMNCRGLTELVALNVGLDLGVISRSTFSVLVLMALITTAATSPALAGLDRLTRRKASAAGDPATAAGRGAQEDGTAPATAGHKGRGGRADEQSD